jgi:membrane-associated phospholipid phosphatase
MLNIFDLALLECLPKQENLLFSIASFLSNPKGNLLLWGSLTLLMLLRTRKAHRLFSSLFVLTNMIMFLCGILKIALGRARPILLEKDISGLIFFTTDNDYLSFPSSHTAIAVGISYFIVRYFNKEKYIIFGLTYSIIVAIARISLRQHFATDTIAGACIGFLMAHLLLYLIERVRLSNSLFWNNSK